MGQREDLRPEFLGGLFLLHAVIAPDLNGEDNLGRFQKGDSPVSERYESP
jgi:hypothetical protein